MTTRPTRLALLLPLGLGLAGAAITYSCRATAPNGARLRDDSPAAPAEGELSEDRWRNKVSQRLRYGSRITTEEEATLAGLDRRQFVAKMMADPRFALTLLDFNMDFLGRQIDHLVELVGAPAAPQFGGFGGDDDDFTPQVVPAAAAVVAATGTGTGTGTDAVAATGTGTGTDAVAATGTGTGTASGTGTGMAVETGTGSPVVPALPAGPNPFLTAAVFAQPAALAGASALTRGGDYFDFFNANPPLLFESPAALSAQPDFKLRLAADFDKAITAFGAPPVDANVPSGCLRIATLATRLAFPQGQFASDPYAAAKLDPSVRNILNLIGQNWVGTLSRTLIVGDFNQVQVGECQKQPLNAPDLVTRLTRIKAATLAVIDQIDARKRPQTDQPMMDLVALDLAPFGDLPALNPAFSFDGQWKILKNSSTNENRKRAAYILRTYTCDDMTPVSTGGGDHMEGGGLHASQPACQACHYKMDPIAAIFAPLGIGGVDFRTAKEHVFDDALKMDRASDQYQKNYLGEYRGADGRIKIGHFKAADRLYAEWTESDADKVSLTTLFDYFKQSQIVRACLTKRLTEYVLGKKQVYDGKWIDLLARNFEGAADGTEAVKRAVTAIVMSKTFARATVQPGQCYDYGPGGEPGPDSPPCEVASILNKYCKSCHNEDNPSGDLDVTKWIKNPAGGNQFAHFLKENVLLDRKTSFKWLIASITNPKSIKRDKDGDGTEEPLLLMPYKKDFPESEKQILYKWLDKQLSDGNN